MGGQCFIQVEAAVVDRMRAMRRRGESYSQVILRLVELETGDLKGDTLLGFVRALPQKLTACSEMS